MRHSKVSVWRWSALVVLAVLVAGPIIYGLLARKPVPARLAAAVATQPVRLMVQLEGSPLADAAEVGVTAQEARLQAEQSDFRAQLKNAGIQYKELSAHHKLFNGLTIQVQAADALRVNNLPGVTGVFVSRQTEGPAPMLASSTKMIGAQKAWAGDPALKIPGVNGSGITVAIIDTGIDYTHPDLGGCFGKGCRVIGGYDFVGDTFDGVNNPVPDNDPMDLNGHGTHVAGIVGAKAASPTGVTGVAPGVRFVALKVFGPDGPTWDDIILQAMEHALDLKVDVVKMNPTHLRPTGGEAA